MSTIPTSLLASLPKTDLHVHLDGSLRIPTLIELAKQDGVSLPSYTESGLTETVFKASYRDLPEYLSGFAYTVAVMQQSENLERIAYEFAMDNIEEGVRYVEVRFAPQLHMNHELDMEAVLGAVTRGLDRAKNAFNQKASIQEGHDLPFEYGIIVCALRWFNEHMSGYYKKLFSVMRYARPKEVYATASLELAKAAVHFIRSKGMPIVGFDLAGAESGYPAEDHAAAYQHAHKHFIKKTVHAGEAYGPESIFQAITACYANRIGHGTHLFDRNKIQDKRISDPDRYVQQLVNYIASGRICIEVNLTSNLQTLPELTHLNQHSFRKMLDEKLSATLCTDNRLVSNTTVTQELEKAVEHAKMTPAELRNVIVAGFKGSFFPGSYLEKRNYVRRVMEIIDAQFDAHGLKT